MEFSRNSPMRKNIRLSETAKSVLFKNTETERVNFNKGKLYITFNDPTIQAKNYKRQRQRQQQQQQRQQQPTNQAANQPQQSPRERLI